MSNAEQVNCDWCGYLFTPSRQQLTSKRLYNGKIYCCDECSRNGIKYKGKAADYGWSWLKVDHVVDGYLPEQDVSDVYVGY